MCVEQCIACGAACIIKAPWGNNCLCSVEARYYVNADTISDIQAALTPSVIVNGNNFTIPFTGSAMLKGTAGAGASACGLNLEPSGDLTEALKVSGTVKATIDVGLCGFFNPTPKLKLKALEVDTLTITADDPQLNLDLSGAGVFDGACGSAACSDYHDAAHSLTPERATALAQATHRVGMLQFTLPPMMSTLPPSHSLDRCSPAACVRAVSGCVGALAGISDLLSSVIPKIVDYLLPTMNAGLSNSLASINSLLPKC